MEKTIVICDGCQHEFVGNTNPTVRGILEIERMVDSSFSPGQTVNIKMPVHFCQLQCVILWVERVDQKEALEGG